MEMLDDAAISTVRVPKNLEDLLIVLRKHGVSRWEGAGVRVVLGPVAMERPATGATPPKAPEPKKLDDGLTKEEQDELYFSTPG